MKTPEQEAWTNMMARCNNPRNPRFKQYGAKGIRVCRRWQVRRNFIADMGPRPSPKHTLERKNNLKGYHPSNCVWATARQQNRNYARNRVVKIAGLSKCLTQWCEDLQVNRGMVNSRIQRGWKPAHAILTPIGDQQPFHARYWRKKQ